MRRRRRIRLPRWRAKSYRDRHHLHAYEEEVILSALKAVDGSATVGELMFAFPDRFDRPYLQKALKRMCNKRRVTRAAGQRGFGRRREWRYIVHPVGWS